jgi:hypothetical protein
VALRTSFSLGLDRLAEEAGSKTGGWQCVVQSRICALEEKEGKRWRQGNGLMRELRMRPIMSIVFPVPAVLLFRAIDVADDQIRYRPS